MNTSEILDKAADLIEERGWTQGWYCGPRGTLCGAGALYAACGIEPPPTRDDNWPPGANIFDHAVSEAWSVLDTRMSPFSLQQWNDAEGRTKEEVVSALRAAARAER